jgi:tRNA(Ile)-lysidine synthase
MKHPKAVARRLIRWAVERVKGDARQIGLAHIEAVMELAARQHDGHGRVILPGVDVMRSFEWIRFSVYAPEARDHVAERNWELPVTVPGEAIASDGSRIRLETVPAGQEPPAGNENDTVETSEIACEAVVRLRAVTLRNWRPGDKYRPSGHGNVEKLKAMFQECRVPLWDRATWPIISIGEEIIWSRKFGPAACGVEGKDASGSVLRITRFE